MIVSLYSTITKTMWGQNSFYLQVWSHGSHVGQAFVASDLSAPLMSKPQITTFNDITGHPVRNSWLHYHRLHIPPTDERDPCLNSFFQWANFMDSVYVAPYLIHLHENNVKRNMIHTILPLLVKWMTERSYAIERWNDDGLQRPYDEISNAVGI